MLKLNLKTVIFWLLVFFFLINIHLRGITPFDEGQILSAAKKILDGQLPYRDFQFFYTPGSIFSVAIAFKLFGTSVFIERILSFSVSLTSSILIYKIVYRLIKKAYLSYIPVVIFILWGPAVINFSWPIVFCILFGLFNIYLLTKLLKREGANIFLIGLSAGLVFIFKQNFGVAILIANLLSFFLIKELRNKKFIINYLFGYLTIFLSFLFYLVSTNSFIYFFREMYFFTYIKIIKEGMLATTFIYPGTWYTKIARTTLYLLPLLISLIALRFSFKSRKVFLPAIFFVLSFYLLGIRPTTDFVHLSPLIAITSIPLAMFFLFKKYRKYALILSLILISLGIYNLTFRGYYRWESPIFTNDIYNGGKLGILINSKHNNSFQKILPLIKDSKSDYIFVYHYSPIFYFLSDKKNPTRYDYLPPGIFDEKTSLQVLKKLDEKGVDTILTDKDLLQNKGLFALYLGKNYKPVLTLSELTIWKR